MTDVQESQILQDARITRADADALVQGLIVAYGSRNKVGHGFGRMGTSGSGYVKRLLDGRTPYTREVLEALMRMVAEHNGQSSGGRVAVDMTWLKQLPGESQEPEATVTGDADAETAPEASGPTAADHDVTETPSTRGDPSPNDVDMTSTDQDDWRNGVRTRLADCEAAAAEHRRSAEALRAQAAEQDEAALRLDERATRIRSALEILEDV